MSLDKNTDFVNGLIELYHSHRCLWCMKEKAYSDKAKRNAALDDLLEFCRPYYTTATKDWLRKRLQNLRTVFIKEHKKVEQSKRSGAGTDEVYNPTLWYYPQLLFLVDQQPERSGFTSLPRMTAVEANVGKSSQAASSSGSDANRPNTSELTFPEDHEESQSLVSPPEETPVPGCSASETPSPPAMLQQALRKRYRKQRHTTEEEDAIYQQIKRTLSKPPNRYDKYAVYLASSLEELDADQVEQFERLAFDLLYQGRRRLLNDNIVVGPRSTVPSPTQPQPNLPTQPQPNPPTQPQHYPTNQPQHNHPSSYSSVVYRAMLEAEDDMTSFWSLA